MNRLRLTLLTMEFTDSKTGHDILVSLKGGWPRRRDRETKRQRDGEKQERKIRKKRQERQEREFNNFIVAAYSIVACLGIH